MVDLRYFQAGAKILSSIVALRASVLLVASRSASWIISGTRLRVFDSQECSASRVSEGIGVLFEADLRFEIDNMEGLAVHQTPAGKTVLTLISDDNFSAVKRNELLQFTLAGP
jgi:hypothetical protein